MRSPALKNYLLTAAATLLTVSLALAAGLLSLTDTFPLTVDLSLLLRLIFLSALGSALLYAVPLPALRRGMATLVLGLLALYVWWRWDGVLTGAQVVFHQISYTFFELLPGVPYYDLPMPLAPIAMHRFTGDFLTAAVPLLALWLGPWLTLRRPVWPAVGTVAALVGLPLLLLLQPGAAPLAAFLLFLSLVILSRRGYRDTAAAGARRVLAAALPAALTVAILGACLSGISPRPLWVEDLRLAALDLPDHGFSLGPQGQGSSPLGRQPFGDLGPLHFTGQTALQINSTSSQSPLFLRGFSAGEYTAKGWMPIEDETDPYPLDGGAGDPALFPYLTQSGRTTESVTVTDLAAASRCYYLPYYPSALPGDAVPVDDAYLERPWGVDEYRVSFLPAGETDPSARLAGGDGYAAQQEYARWVRAHYLDVPYGLLSGEAAAMAEDFAASVPYGAGPVEVGHQVKTYLASFTQYDQSTPHTPEGEDFVSWFLTESHRGYCVHYASAATLLLRACGVPARYAAGYVARPGRANAVTNIPDRNAHAWVEVYVDGFGWQPVDVTPGFSGGGELDDPAATPTPSATPSPSPSAAATPTPTATPSAPPSAPPQNGAAPGPAGFALPPALLPLLLGLLCAGGLVGLICAQAALRRARLRERCTRSEPNEAALALYRCLLALQRRAGIAVPQEALDLAQKAAFSQHTLTGEELAVMRDFARAAARRAGALPLWRRLVLKYVWALL